MIGHTACLHAIKVLAEPVVRIADADFVSTDGYLRNDDVEWDRFELGDIKQMVLTTADRRRYEVRRGDHRYDADVDA